MKKVIVIVGPTGVGKTKLSIELAKRINGEIINGDSTQVYKELSIGTAKIKEEEKEGIPHHLFDIKSINEDYTVYDYQKDCRLKIDEIINRGSIPIIVGGTGLYIKAALYNYIFEEDSNNFEYDNYTNEELYNMLKEKYNDINIHPNNRKRLIRALNTNNISKEKTNELLYDAIFIELTLDRDILYDRINNRVDIMFNEGLEEEAHNIYLKNIRSKAVMTPIGYKELFQYFDNEITKKEAIELIKQRSRRYAKRQLTWNRHQFNTKEFNVDLNNFNNVVESVIKYINN